MEAPSSEFRRQENNCGAAVQAMKFYRLSGGQFVEEHGQSDMLALLKQIGAVPTA